jgi:F-type H+-transporting ATPase subunit b
MLFQVSSAFGFNTNLFETNVLNLIVVVGIVVKVGGDALSTLLDQRRQTIVAALKETDKKIRDAQAQLDEARRAVEASRLRAEEIRIQAIQMADLETSKAQKQLKEDLVRLQEKSRQELQSERQRIIQGIVQKVADISLVSAENILFEVFRSQGTTSQKQRELNEIYVKEIFSQLKLLP